MAQIIDTIIQSDTPPKKTNVLWDNGVSVMRFKDGKWQPFTNEGEVYDDTQIKKDIAICSKQVAVLNEEVSTIKEDIENNISQLENIEYSLTTKADKSKIPTKLSDLEQDIEIGSSYDDTEIRNAIDNKVDSDKVATINGQSLINGGNIEIKGGGESYDDTELREAISLRNVGAEDTDESVDEPEIGGSGASTDRQGVVSQTLTYNSADNTYSVSNVVRGSIPSFFIDLVTEAGASFNAESGYFSLNGIDNIAYDEMRQIYDCRTGYGTNSLLAVYGKAYTARTNFVAFRGYGSSYANHEPTTIYTKYLCVHNASITKFALCSEVALYVRAGSGNNFEALGLGGSPLDRSRLEEIIGIIDVSNLTGSANFFYNGAHQPWLTSFQLKSLKASIDLSGMPRLSEATILYMINNEKATAAITIKLHADAKAMADASEAIQSALENHANIALGV